MAAFILLCRDKPDALDLRLATREAHRTYVADAGASILLAGPTMNEQDAPMGSVFIIEAENEEAVRNFAANDPFARAGLFESVEINPFKLVTGALLRAHQGD